MTLHRLAIFLFSAAMLSGLILFGHLLINFIANSTSGSLAKQIQSSPLNWSYALICCIFFISFLIWLPSRLPAWRFQFAFRRIDSATLDTNTEICSQFYREALAFRCQYGSRQFERHIIGHFDFVYNYHHDALRWMNDIVNGIASGPVPVDFIVASIGSGQIGRIYTGACYGGGLASSAVALNEPVFLHARLDSVEIWSASSVAPVSILRRQPLELVQAQGQPDNTRCYLTGLEKSSGNPLRLELRCPSCSTGQSQHSESPTPQPLQAFRSWIEELAPSVNHSNQNNFGIDVAEIHAQDDTIIAQPEITELDQQLQQLLGSHIDGFFTCATLPITDANLAPDAVVLCSGLGIVTITEIPLTGSITYSGDPTWVQIDEGYAQNFDNPCLEGQRAKATLANLLSTQGLIKWPVQNLVVFSDPAVSLNLAVGKQRVQCEVTTLKHLPNWFAARNTNDTIHFNKDDYNRFIALLDPARVQVEQAMQA